MSKKYDLEYIEQGIFVAFVPNTKQGEIAWAQIAEQTEGTGKVFLTQLEGTIQQLKAAGYTVHKAKPVKLTDKELDNICKELGI